MHKSTIYFLYVECNVVYTYIYIIIIHNTTSEILDIGDQLQDSEKLHSRNQIVF